MKKIYLLTIVAALITLVAASCGNAPKPTSSEEATTQQATDEQSAIDDDAPNPAPPPPAAIVGTWKAPAKVGRMAYLEIFVDGMAGLYLGYDDDPDIDEIYRGTVLAISESADKIELKMNLELEWYIYESNGSPIEGVPASYEGVYTLRLEQNGNKQMLHLKANANATPLFGSKELQMERVQKTEGNGRMWDIK